MPRRAPAIALAVLLAAATANGEHPVPLGRGETAWRDSARGAIRGLTIGPIESSLHPGKGYGTAACARAMDDARRMGANWVSLTPFGRTWDLAPSGVDPTFEAPFAVNRIAVARAVQQAHTQGLRVLLVPHLWVETGGWRALIDPGTDAAWEEWAAGYRRFVLGWARVAQSSGVDMFAIGVEMRNFATTTHAPLLSSIIRDIRHVYDGLLTYAANWDDVDDTVILGDLDVIGVNAFFPLSDRHGATFAELEKGGQDAAAKMRTLAETWHKPIVFTEIGYTNRKDAAVEPWTWPDAMKDVTTDPVSQAESFAALLAPFVAEPWFAGFFVWRVYADPDDMSQEAEWGFSPRGKLAELVVRDAFAARWAADGPTPSPGSIFTPRASIVGF